MIRGTSVTLRAPHTEDIPYLARLRNDLTLQKQLMVVPRPNSNERVQDWVARRMNDEHGVFFVVAAGATALPCGFIQLTDIDFLHRRANLGVCIGPEAQGRGYGGEALELTEAYAAAILSLRKIVIHVLSHNTAAVVVYERAGYSRVGVHQEHFFQDGRFCDVLVMEKRIPEVQR